jgi:cobalt-zinc-cadmium efflux system membrane fusion protein
MRSHTLEFAHIGSSLTPALAASLTCALLISLAIGGTACSAGRSEEGDQDSRPTEAVESHADAHGHEAAAAMDEQGHGDPSAPEVSDLDRPVSELLQARCEHEIPMHTCDECRYEVGTVKVERELFGERGPLDTLIVSRRAVLQSLELTGEVELDASRSVYISPRAPGIVRTIRMDLGSRVETGQVLFEIESPEFSQAKADFRRAHAAHALAAATREREADLFARKICPQKDLLEAQAALDAASADERASRERLLSSRAETGAGWLPVRAPFAGTILERDLNLGAAVEPGERLLLLGETDRMWVITSVYERELALLLEHPSRDHLLAEIEVPAYPGRRFTGSVDRLQGTLDDATRTTRIRILVDNPGGLLRAGMFARVRLMLPGEEEALAVPPEAVLEDEGRAFVFVRALPSYFVRRPVTVGRAWPGWLEISAGLAGGEALVTRGAFMLKSDVLRSKMGAGCAD